MSVAKPVKWQVTNVVDGTGKDKSGNYVPGKTVTYQIEEGPSETVFIPGNPPTMETVATEIRARAANLSGIHTLTSES